MSDKLNQVLSEIKPTTAQIGLASMPVKEQMIHRANMSKEHLLEIYYQARSMGYGPGITQSALDAYCQATALLILLKNGEV